MRIEALTHLGAGRASDGTLVPRTLPGEEIALRPDGSAQILTPSDQRVAPPCRHYRGCGGCALQHASDPFVAGFKQGIVERALSAHGLTPPFRGLHTSPPRSRRRAKFAGRRTKKGALVGFHARGSDTLVAVPDCQLVTPRLTAALPMLEALTVLAASRRGEVALTVTESDAGLDVRVDSEQPLTDQLRLDLAVFAQTHGLARLSWGEDPIAMIHPPGQVFGPARVVPPAGAFLQATAEGEAALRDAVTEILGDAARVVDLFAGCGTFSLPLSQRAEIHAVEGEAAMLDALDQGWRRAQGLKRITTEVRDLFRRPLEPDELNRFDAAVIDPPRAGAEAQVATLARSSIQTIAMVSCNPVTFGRDVAVLVNAGFTIDWVKVVDQFRWSPHTELVARVTRG
ncbi:class I SAM-dependent RNA methyltransferase [Salipiger sp. IMCC34102]|uniref:class I SAM-dependent RNA methyltransferase n=1 Tax=Salipiger sp. IMCC34102 TaxID=2510647 RepID=UPI00101D233C|nr:class I SAM-dependent RNA methyltransferase [Salipiger sp. IMCC34102]RYH04193.1 class I SAM-dependent RNA methyltransferase [Salipiger sp. IMCC34102]